jgi:hypothetical protein
VSTNGANNTSTYARTCTENKKFSTNDMDNCSPIRIDDCLKRQKSTDIFMQIKSQIFHALKMIRVMCINMIKKVENYFTDYNIDIVIIEVQSVLTYINNLYIIHKNRIHIDTKNQKNLKKYSPTSNQINISKKEVNEYKTLLDDKNGNLISRFFWQKYFNSEDFIIWRRFSAAFEFEYVTQQVYIYIYIYI